MHSEFMFHYFNTLTVQNNQHFQYRYELYGCPPRQLLLHDAVSIKFAVLIHLILTPHPLNKVILLRSDIKAFQSLVKLGFFVLNNTSLFFCGSCVPRCTKRMPDYVLRSDIHNTFLIFFRPLFKCCLRECMSQLRSKLRGSGQQSAIQARLSR